jgi:hypothetical protein
MALQIVRVTDDRDCKIKVANPNVINYCIRLGISEVKYKRACILFKKISDSIGASVSIEINEGTASTPGKQVRIVGLLGEINKLKQELEKYGIKFFDQTISSTDEAKLPFQKKYKKENGMLIIRNNGLNQILDTNIEHEIIKAITISNKPSPSLSSSSSNTPNSTEQLSNFNTIVNIGIVNSPSIAASSSSYFGSSSPSSTSSFIPTQQSDNDQRSFSVVVEPSCTQSSSQPSPTPRPETKLDGNALLNNNYCQATSISYPLVVSSSSSSSASSQSIEASDCNIPAKLEVLKNNYTYDNLLKFVQEITSSPQKALAFLTYASTQINPKCEELSKNWHTFEDIPTPTDDKIHVYEHDQSKYKLAVMPAVGKLRVIGDVHGQYTSISEISKGDFSELNSGKMGWVCLGDYVDRGKHSLKTIVMLLTIKCLRLRRVILLRGNHELAHICIMHGFFGELKKCFPNDQDASNIFYKALEVFDQLPLVAIDKCSSTFFLHGAPPVNIHSIYECLSSYDELLWNDIDSQLSSLYTYNSRGGFCHVLSKKIIDAICKSLKCERIVRAHQTMPNISAAREQAIQFNNRAITVFSTGPQNRGDQYNIDNDGFYANPTLEKPVQEAYTAVLYPGGSIDFEKVFDNKKTNALNPNLSSSSSSSSSSSTLIQQSHYASCNTLDTNRDMRANNPIPNNTSSNNPSSSSSSNAQQISKPSSSTHIQTAQFFAEQQRVTFFNTPITSPSPPSSSSISQAITNALNAASIILLNDT